MNQRDAGLEICMPEQRFPGTQLRDNKGLNTGIGDKYGEEETDLRKHQHLEQDLMMD